MRRPSVLGAEVLRNALKDETAMSDVSGDKGCDWPSLS
jgi:hypothetical protein